MIAEPYKTDLGSLTPINKIIEEITKAFIVTDVDMSYNFKHFYNLTPLLITGRDKEADITPFKYPIVLEYRGKRYIALDVRESTVQEDNFYRIRDTGKFNLSLVSALFTAASDAGLEGPEYNILLKLTDAYAVVMVNSLTKALHATTDDTLAIQIIFRYYWLSNLDKADRNEHNIDDLVARIAISLGFKSPKQKEYIHRVLLSTGILNPTGIFDIVKSIANATTSHSYKGITTGVIYSSVASSFYSVNSELMYMAAEHLPTFTSIAYSAVSTKSFKHSLVAQLFTRYKRVIDTKQIQSSINDIVQTHILDI